MGIAKTTAAERSVIGYPTSYWSGYCAGFAYAAYQLGGRVTPRDAGDARPRYQSYRAAGRLSTTGEPNVGAQVFYPNVSSFGHVTVYLGNGMVATTVGLPGGTAKNTRVAMTSFGAPAGWVNPNNV